MTDADKTALGWYNQNIQWALLSAVRRLPAYLPRAGWISASLTVVSCMPTVTGEWTWRGRSMPCWPGAAARDSAWTVRIAQPGASTVSSCRAGWRRPKDVLLSGCAGGAAVRMELSTKQPEGQASEEFNDRRGFLETGAFGTAALAAGTGCGEEALPPAPYEGTPHFVRSAAPG